MDSVSQPTPDQNITTPVLDVLIASYGKEGLSRLSRIQIPIIKGVRWLISSQIPEGDFPAIPDSLQREDIFVEFSVSKGSSYNRNLLLDRATSPLCLIADDDLIFYRKGIIDIINTFKDNPEISMAAFMYDVLPTEYRHKPIPAGIKTSKEKQYQDYIFPLDKPAKGFYISAIEIAFRRVEIQKRNIRFNENFGVHAPYACGEDTIFLHDCLSAGLKGNFYPILIATHLGLSTGQREVSNPDILRSQGILIPLLYPMSGLPRLFLKAWRSSRCSSRSFLYCSFHLLKGWKDFLLYKKRLFPPKG